MCTQSLHITHAPHSSSPTKPNQTKPHRATLTDYGVSSDDATAVVRLYKEAHDGILQQLQSTG